jgi:hypothetical protein
MKKVLLAGTVILLMAIMGCESNMLGSLADESSKEAKIEEAKIAIDDGNYQKAITTLNSYKNSPDPKIAGLLASAHMGAAGVDLTYMLEHTNVSDTNKFDVIASAFFLRTSDQLNASSSALYKAESDASPRFITTDTAVGLLTDLSLAVGYLSISQRTNPDDDDLTVQLGIASALHFIIDIGYIVAEAKDCNIPINKAAYQMVFPQTPDLITLGNLVNTYLTINQTDLQEFKGDLAGLCLDLWNVFLMVEVFKENIGPDEDITSSFNKFITDSLGLPQGSSKDAIKAKVDSYDGSALVSFINSKLLGYD